MVGHPLRILLASWLLTASAAHAAEPRFSGQGQLRPAPVDSVQHTVDGRFALTASSLRVAAPTPKVSSSRFALEARLHTRGSSCDGGDTLFRNGFESN